MRIMIAAILCLVLPAISLAQLPITTCVVNDYSGPPPSAKGRIRLLEQLVYPAEYINNRWQPQKQDGYGVYRMMYNDKGFIVKQEDFNNYFDTLEKTIVEYKYDKGVLTYFSASESGKKVLSARFDCIDSLSYWMYTYRFDGQDSVLLNTAKCIYNSHNTLAIMEIVIGGSKSLRRMECVYDAEKFMTMMKWFEDGKLESVTNNSVLNRDKHGNISEILSEELKTGSDKAVNTITQYRYVYDE
jgi:hypothetical protein